MRTHLLSTCAAALLLFAVAAQPAAAAPSCELGQPQDDASEALNARGAFAPTTGTSEMVLLFVDFPDAPGSEDPQAIHDAMVPAARLHLAVASYGRYDVQVRPHLAWVRMPHPSSHYGFDDDLTYERHHAFFRDAIRAADPAVDFTGAELVDIVASAGAAMPTSAKLNATSEPLVADGTEIMHGASHGKDLRDGDAVPYQWAAPTFVHELGHSLGLPDLYRYDRGDIHRDAGAWDIMGDLYPGSSFNAWHRRKLGWLDAEQTVCVATPRTVTTTLTPLDEPGGRKLVVLKDGPARGVTVEVRRRAGLDSGLCSAGVVVSRIDATRGSGEGAVVVQRARDAPPSSRCGVTGRAAFRPGGVARAGRVTVKVQRAVGTGYRVRATLAR